jgi:hypothetical protein
MTMIEHCMREGTLLRIGVIAEKSLDWLPSKTNTSARAVSCLALLHLSKPKLGSSMDIGTRDQKVIFEIAFWSIRNPPLSFVVKLVTTRY